MSIQIAMNKYHDVLGGGLSGIAAILIHIISWRRGSRSNQPGTTDPDWTPDCMATNEGTVLIAAVNQGNVPCVRQSSRVAM